MSVFKSRISEEHVIALLSGKTSLPQLEQKSMKHLVCSEPGSSGPLLAGPLGSFVLKVLPAIKSHVRSGKTGCRSENKTVQLKAGEKLKS